MISKKIEIIIHVIEEASIHDNLNQISPQRALKKGDFVLYWDKGMLDLYHGFHLFCRGSYIIDSLVQHNSFHITTLDGEWFPLVVDGNHLEIYSLDTS